jgi:hypothetical protein
MKLEVIITDNKIGTDNFHYLQKITFAFFPARVKRGEYQLEYYSDIRRFAGFYRTFRRESKRTQYAEEIGETRPRRTESRAAGKIIIN